MLKCHITSLMLCCSLDCMGLDIHLDGFDFATCTRWEFTTDIVEYKAPEYVAAVAKAKKLEAQDSLKTQDSDWTVFQAINHKTYGKALFGICRHVFTPSNRPVKFECAEFGTFPISGMYFSVVKDTGMYSSSYRCTKSCTNAIGLVHEHTSEDEPNFELRANFKKFNEQCRQGPIEK